MGKIERKFISMHLVLCEADWWPSWSNWKQLRLNAMSETDFWIHASVKMQPIETSISER